MNELDFIILAAVLISAVIGLMRGFFREILSLMSWLVAIWAAFFYADLASDWFAGWIADPKLRKLAGGAALLVGVLLLLTMVSYFLHRFVAGSAVSGADRGLGLLFGLTRGILIIATLVIFTDLTRIPQADWWQGSSFLVLIEPLVDWIRTILPDALMQRITTAP